MLDVRPLLRFLLRFFYHYRAFNVAALTTPGPVLLLPNHASWWDWLLIGVWLDDDWRFVTSSTVAEISWLHKRMMINRRTFPVDMNSPFAVKRMAEYLQQGGRLVLFPEGRLTCTGSLMKIFDGTGFLILKTRAKVITAHLRGAQRRLGAAADRDLVHAVHGRSQSAVAVEEADLVFLKQVLKM